MQGIEIRIRRKRRVPDLWLACRQMFQNLPRESFTSYRSAELWWVSSEKFGDEHGFCSPAVLWVFYMNWGSRQPQGPSCQSGRETPHSTAVSCATLTLKMVEIFIAIYNGTLIVSLKEQRNNYLEISANLQFWDLQLTLEQWVTLTLLQSQKLLNGWIRAMLLPCMQGILK